MPAGEPVIRKFFSNLPILYKGIALLALPLIASVFTLNDIAQWQTRGRQVVDRVNFASETQTVLRLLLRDLLNMEVAIRGYALTRNPETLKPFHESREAINRDIQEINKRLEKYPAQAQRFNEVETRSQALAASIASLIERMPADTNWVLRSKQAMDDLRIKVGELESAQDVIIADANEELRMVRERRPVLIFWGFALPMVAGALSIFIFTGGISGRIAQLTAGARRLQDGEKLGALPEGKDELGVLAVAMRDTYRAQVSREAALAEARSFLEHLINSSPVVLMKAHLPNFAIDFISPNVSQLLGRQPEEFIQKPSLWLSLLHPDEVEAATANLLQAASGEAGNLRWQWRMQHADGNYRWVDWSFRLEQLRGARSAVPSPLAETARAAAAASRSENAAAAAGATSTFPLLDPKAAVALYRAEVDRLGDAADNGAEDDSRAPHPGHEPTAILIGCLQDITAQREAEAAITQLNLRLQDQVLEMKAVNHELESFSYSVSHDLRAPLRHVAGFSNLLSRDAASMPEKTQRYVKVIADSVRQMGVLIDDLLAFSRMGRSEMVMTPLDLNELLHEVITGFAVDIGERAINWQIAPLPTVQGDPTLLRLVLQNLVGNAIKYTRNTPEARIEIGPCPPPEGQEESHCIFVRDNGAGFDMQYVDKLFGVFQRLHRSEEFEGTGIGLASVRRIIYRHGGNVQAFGEVGKGATFTFLLPKNAKEAIRISA